MNIQKKAIDLTSLATGILILGILVSIGVYILVALRDSRVTSLNTELFNENITPLDAGTKFTKQYFKEIGQCYNGTQLIGSGNYTVTQSGATGILTNLTTTYAGTEMAVYGWTCNYTTYNLTRPDYTLPDKASIGLAEYGNWFKIMVIVGVTAIILALIFMAFGRGANSVEGGGGSY